MKMKKKWCNWFFYTILIALSLPTAVYAQAEVSLRLSRDFGASTGAGIRGTFSYRVDIPEDVIEVQFLLDGEVIATDVEEPFRHQFQTSDFADGRHTLQVIATTSDGTTLESNVLTRTFLSQSESTDGVLWVLIPILILMLGGRWVAGVIAKRNRDDKETEYPIYGILGGTICPNCQRPFAFHWWSLNLTFFRLDKCPHCGKWNRLNRMARPILEATCENASNLPPVLSDTQEKSPPDDLDQRLDDSKFMD